jgi:hypothetical protein
MEGSQSDIALWIMGPFSSLIGSGLTIWAGRSIKDSLRSRHWPRANAIVTVSEVREITTDGNDYFIWQVEYVFEVSGRQIKGNAVRFGGDENFETKSEVEDQVGKFPVGSRILVIYNPDRPQRCALQSNVFKGASFIFIAGLVFLAFGITMLKQVIGI